MDRTTATDRTPPPARLSSSSSLSRHSRNGRRAPQDNRSNSVRSSQHSRRQSKRPSSSSETSRVSRHSTNGRDNNKKQPEKRSNFTKWAATVVIFIAIVDLVVLWTSIDATIGDQNGNLPHQIGPEVGIHQFTEKMTTDFQIQLMQDIAQKQHEKAKQEYPKKRTRSEMLRIEEERRRQGRYQYQPIRKVKNVAKADKVNNDHTFGIDEHIVNILTAANIQLDAELASQLPSWGDIVSMYGDKPIIHGLETCKKYRDTVDPADRMLGPAGLFNTGTNLLFELMKANCNIKEARTSKTHREPTRNGMRFQPPWGKVRLELHLMIAVCVAKPIHSVMTHKYCLS